MQTFSLSTPFFDPGAAISWHLENHHAPHHAAVFTANKRAEALATVATMPDSEARRWLRTFVDDTCLRDVDVFMFDPSLSEDELDAALRASAQAAALAEYGVATAQELHETIQRGIVSAYGPPTLAEAMRVEIDRIVTEETARASAARGGRFPDIAAWLKRKAEASELELPDDDEPESDAADAHTESEPEASSTEGPTVFSVATLAGMPIQKRAWIVPDLIPCNTVTMLSGDGGVGKSLIAAQLAVAVATGREWVGLKPRRGPVVFISAEDDLGEIHRRLVDIAAPQGVNLADIGDMYVSSLAGQDAVMGAPEGRTSVIKKTALWKGLESLVADVKPSLVVLDTLADIFAGSEIVRTEVRQFISILRGLAIENDLAVVLLSHPSLTGMSSGKGTSGSTAWNNSVRSRLYLDRVLEPDGSEPDKSLRALRVMKANYGPVGGEIRLRWSKGAFERVGAPAEFSFGAAAEAGDALRDADRQADRVFLALLAKFWEQGRYVSHKKGSPSYAPHLFTGYQVASEGIRKRAFESAMDRLLDARKIRAAEYGPPSDGKMRLVFVSSDDPIIAENKNKTP